ncbi:MAG: hypothetical protein M0Z40_10585, partial [Actinomycetota bacterium]|nr:hypothetical protein [Actinomycetota bacterium]
MVVSERSAHTPAGARGQRAASLLSRTDRVGVPAAAAAVAGTLFVLARLLVVAKGDLSRFVMAGRDFVNP